MISLYGGVKATIQLIQFADPGVSVGEHLESSAADFYTRDSCIQYSASLLSCPMPVLLQTSGLETLKSSRPDSQ